MARSRAGRVAVACLGARAIAGAAAPAFALTAVEEVPVSGPSLSQELVGASWQLELAAATEATEPPSAEAWQGAAAALLASDSWIWHDTDKKGRPRSRECRPDLLALSLEPQLNGGVLLRYSAAIDPAGRSLRPEQLQHWFTEHLGQPLLVQRLRRESLQLRQS